MIKKYVMAATVMFVILMFTSTSTASYLFSNGEIYEHLSENSFFNKLLEKVSRVLSNKDNSALLKVNENNDEDIDLIDENVPEENVLSPDIIDIDTSDEIPTIDADGENGAIQTVVTIVEDNDLGVNNEITIEKDGTAGRTTINRLIGVVIEHNGKIGAILQRVIERTFAPGTIDSNTKSVNIVDNVVVVGSDVTTVENN